MSIQALTVAMALRCVSPSEKLLLLALANYADEDMKCFPSQRRLAEDTCLTARTIRSLLAGLEARGMLSRVARERRDGSRASDVVTLNITGDVFTPPTQISGGGETISGGVGKPFPGGAEMVSGLTTFEPSPEPSKTEPIEAKRRLRLVPDAWFPAEKVLADLAVLGFVSGEIERELANFRDHEFRDPKSDFDRAFRRWMKNSRTFQTGRPHERPHHDAKFDAKQANYARAWEGSERAARFRGEP